MLGFICDVCGGMRVCLGGIFYMYVTSVGVYVCILCMGFMLYGCDHVGIYT